MTHTVWIIAEVFVGLSVLMLLTAFLTRWFSPPRRSYPAEILKARYARGEISRAEYQQMAADLGITVPAAANPMESTDDRQPDPGSTTGHAY